MKIREAHILIAVFLAAFIIRLAFIGNYLGQDEVYYVGYANDILHGRAYTSAYSPFFYYFLIPFVVLFNNSEVFIHAFMAFLGAVNVALVYFIGRKFANKWVGIFAALLLMFNTTHWFFSDFAMLDMPVTLFSTAAFFFYWSGYKSRSVRYLLLAAMFSSVAILTKYGFFALIALLGYIVIFDRKSLRNKYLLASIIIPFIAFGLWMLYFVNQQGWLWSWWSNYIQGGTGLASPYYQYAAATWYEYLLPIPSLFFIFTSLYLLAKKKVRHKMLWLPFLAAFIISSLYAFANPMPFEWQAALGAATLILISLSLVKNNFYRYAIIYVAAVFIFYSAIALKFPRYMLPALPVLYILAAGVIDSFRKIKPLFIAAILVIIVFAAFNFIDTSNKLVLDKEINTVKHAAQQYVNDNSPECSKVYSKTWYGFYYLRTRISDLPISVSDVSQNAACPPYFISEGFLDQKYVSQLQKVKDFSSSVIQYALDSTGFRSYVNNITPIQIYVPGFTLGQTSAQIQVV